MEQGDLEDGLGSDGHVPRGFPHPEPGLLGKLPAPRLGQGQEISRRVPLAGGCTPNAGMLRLTTRGHRVGETGGKRASPLVALLSGLLELAGLEVRGLRPP